MTASKSAPALLSEIAVPLAVPVSVTGADNKPAKRDTITLRRPKFVHAKKLAIMIGPQFLKALMADPEIAAAAARKSKSTAATETAGEPASTGSEIDIAALITEVGNGLLTVSGMDGLTELIANMADETPELIDQLDIVDILSVGKAVLGFFPALQSLIASK